MMEQLMHLTDEQLVKKYELGDNASFDVLLNRHKTTIFSYIFYTVKDEDLANDIFQDTFIKAVVNIRQGRYTENGKFRAWITRIAHNLVIDHFRQGKNITKVSNEETGYDLLNNTKFSEDTLEEKIVKNQVLSDVKSLIDYLPESQKEVVIMRYYKELSFKEIATATGVSINTALGRMRYALLNLRRIADEHQVNLTFD